MWFAGVAIVLTTALMPFRVSAQDTTRAYPWHTSYFPYLTASPNDGVMAMGRIVFFRQSRWDDRVPLHDEVAVEGGYSTKDSWLARARADMPRLATGWRLQLVAQAERDEQYEGDAADSISVSRQFVAAEVSRSLGGPFILAARGEASHIDGQASAAGVTETDVRGRIALVIDQRDREYDTRSGSLIQGGFFFGSPSGTSQSSYTGEYGMVSGWLPLGERTRITARVAGRFSNHLGIDASRIIPAWEDDVLVAGGPESNRALPIAARVNNCAYLASAELRHDLRVFPGGAITLLAFVDGTRTDNCGRDDVTVVTPRDTLPGLSTTAATPTTGWVWGPGVGVALRLLRNAVLTATVARALGATRVYVSSGWSW